MKIDKRAIALTLCVVIALWGSLLTCIELPADITGGQGDGRNRRVRDVEQLNDVIIEISNHLECILPDQDDYTTVSAVKSSDEKERYTSATIKSTANVKFDREFYVDNKLDYTHMSIDRNVERTLYLQENGALLMSVRQKMNKYLEYKEEEPSKIYSDIDYDIYIDPDKQVYCYVRAYGNFPIQLLDKWLLLASDEDLDYSYDEFTDENIYGAYEYITDNIFEYIDDCNNWFELLSKQIEKYENDIKERDSDVYALNKDSIKEFALDRGKYLSETTEMNWEFLKMNEDKSLFEIDLTDNIEPKIKFNVSELEYERFIEISNFEGDSGFQYETKKSDYTKENINEHYRISNIGNTVINLGDFRPYDIWDFVDVVGDNYEND